MKKIGIITFYFNNYNYGGILQAYALEHFLNNKLSDDIYAEQICYDREKVKLPLWDRVLRFICRGNLKKKLFSRMSKRNIDFSNYSAIDRFVRTEINHSNKIYDGRNYTDTQNEYDIFICGSDQIWNPIAIRDAYLLIGITKKKISYAASIATGILKLPEHIKLKRSLADFSAISVREDSAKIQLEHLIDKKIVTVVDPVLLLHEDDWNNITSEPPMKEPYIFTYFLGTVGESALNYSNKHKNGRKIISIEGLRFDANDKTEAVLKGIGPREFLSLIKNAEEIWTDSFHALTFSIIFERQFRVFSREGGNSDMSERIRDLLELVNLSPLEQTSFVEAKRILEQKKEQSINFLYKAIYD